MKVEVSYITHYLIQNSITFLKLTMDHETLSSSSILQCNQSIIRNSLKNHPKELVEKLIYLYKSAHDLVLASLSLSHELMSDFVKTILDNKIKLPHKVLYQICHHCSCIQIPGLSCRSKIKTRKRYKKPNSSDLDIYSDQQLIKSKKYKKVLLRTCLLCNQTMTEPCEPVGKKRPSTTTNLTLPNAHILNSQQKSKINVQNTPNSKRFNFLDMISSSSNSNSNTLNNSNNNSALTMNTPQNKSTGLSGDFISFNSSSSSNNNSNNKRKSFNSIHSVTSTNSINSNNNSNSNNTKTTTTSTSINLLELERSKKKQKRLSNKSNNITNNNNSSRNNNIEIALFKENDEDLRTTTNSTANNNTSLSIPEKTSLFSDNNHKIISNDSSNTTNTMSMNTISTSKSNDNNNVSKGKFKAYQRPQPNQGTLYNNTTSSNNGSGNKSIVSPSSSSSSTLLVQKRKSNDMQSTSDNKVTVKSSKNNNIQKPPPSNITANVMSLSGLQTLFQNR